MAKISFFTNGQLVELCIILAAALFFSWAILFSFSRIQHRLVDSTHILNYAIIKAVGWPLVILIWILAFSLIAPILAQSFGATIDMGMYLSPIRSVVTLFSIFWMVMRFVAAIEERCTQQINAGNSNRDITSVRAFSLVIRFLAVVILILMLMHTFGIKITSLLAVGGLGGLALAFAAKDTISNFLGGMMIFWDRPFAVGDWICSPDRQYEGTVQDIGWRLTRIITFDKRPLYIPNGIFSTIAIENPSRMTNRRIKTQIGLRYCDAPKVSGILHDVEKMLRSHPDIDSTQTLMVNLVEFGSSSLNFLVYTFTKTTVWTEFQAVQQDVFLKIIEIIAQHGAECAFPSRSLYIPDPVGVQQSAGETV